MEIHIRNVIKKLIYVIQKLIQLSYMALWGFFFCIYGRSLYRILLTEDKIVASKLAYNCVLHTTFDAFCFIYLLIWGRFLFDKIIKPFSWKQIVIHFIIFWAFSLIHRLWWSHFMYFPIFNQGFLC